MAISLNNHETRIKALESKIQNIPSGSGIVSSSLSANGYCKFANGLLFQWGSSSANPQNFPIAFKQVYICVGSPTASGSQRKENDGIVYLTNTQFKSEILGGRGYSACRFFAIGVV